MFHNKLENENKDRVYAVASPLVSKNFLALLNDSRDEFIERVKSGKLNEILKNAVYFNDNYKLFTSKEDALNYILEVRANKQFYIFTLNGNEKAVKDAALKGKFSELYIDAEKIDKSKIVVKQPSFISHL